MKVNSHKLDGPDLPLALKQIHDPPAVIYYSGAAPSDWLKWPKLGVVGSRKATPYGQAVTKKLVTELTQAGIVIISGLAFGIDSIAHQASLNIGGITVAILPGPLDQIYPVSHRQLAESILRHGGTLISEYPPGSDIRKENFIARNRLIAGLADALLVPQAASHSGSLHTANFALDQGKTVMAVPGDIMVELNAGSNNLLKTGAVMVTESADVLQAMGVRPADAPARQLVHATPEQRRLFDLIRKGVDEADGLALASGLSGSEISSALSLLEIDGYVRANAGRWHIN